MATIVANYTQFKELVGTLAVQYVTSQPGFIAVARTASGTEFVFQDTTEPATFAVDFPTATLVDSIFL